MKKTLIFFCLFILCIVTYTQVNALVTERSESLSREKLIIVTSFYDYPPFGQEQNNPHTISTLFQPFVDALSKNSKHKVEYKMEQTYDLAIENVLNGRIDILLGAYYDTEKYIGIELVYPSILNNPIVPVTMPDRELKLTSKKDLQNLKGAIDSREHLSDYVSNELSKLNIQKFDNSEKLYEQLFIGNVDYILTSRYYGALEQAKLGIRDMVQMSPRAIWDMPLFIGTSALTKNSKRTVNTIKDVLRPQHEQLKKEIQNLIIERIKKADEDARGTVPPSFVK